MKEGLKARYMGHRPCIGLSALRNSKHAIPRATLRFALGWDGIAPLVLSWLTFCRAIIPDEAAISP
jgi:hypothetical protein